MRSRSTSSYRAPRETSPLATTAGRLWLAVALSICLTLDTVQPVTSLQNSATILTARCGGSLQSSWGNYTYPSDFPRRPYPFGLKCRWTVSIPSSTGKVRVTFPYLSLRAMDYLVVADANSAAANSSRPCAIHMPHTSSAPEEQLQAPVQSALSIGSASDASHGGPPGLMVYRGAEAASGPAAEAPSFTASGPSLLIELCPSAFPLATAAGLGIIFTWEDTSTPALPDYDLPTFFPPHLIAASQFDSTSTPS